MQIFRCYYLIHKRQMALKNRLLKRNTLLVITGIITGSIGGYLYYHFVGCRTGTCPLTSNPWLTIVWGAAVGYLIFDLFRKKEAPVSGSKQDMEE